jgi:hypothetical protein
MQIARLALVSAVVLSLACASVRVTTDYDAAVDFAQLQTFAWLDPPLREEARAEGAADADPFTHNTLIDGRVRQEVETWLGAHGYRLAGAAESPDALLRYEVVSREVTRDSPVFVSGGYGRYGYGSAVGYSHSTTYQEGTLIIDVIDPATQRIAWRGWGASDSRSAHMSPERLHESVSAILARFPPDETKERRD